MTPAKRSEYVLEAANFCGIDIYLAYRRGEAKPCAVAVKSIIDAMQNDPDSISVVRQQIRSGHFEATVEFESVVTTSRLLDLNDFFKFCMLNSSPRLDAFRDYLAKIARNVQDHGMHFDMEAIGDDPIDQLLAATLFQRRQMKQFGSELKEVRGELASVKQQIGRGHKYWTVAAWLALHGRRERPEVLTEEGMKLRRVCIQKGYPIPEEKVCNGGAFPARQWPIEAIRIWWPDYCRRKGIPVIWKIGA